MSLDPSNPFAAPSTLEYEMPPFALIRDEHYLPAFYGGMEEQLAEVEAIIAQSDVTFENTIVALERSGRTLLRVNLVFFNKSYSDTSDALDAIEAEIAPKLAYQLKFFLPDFPYCFSAQNLSIPALQWLVYPLRRSGHGIKSNHPLALLLAVIAQKPLWHHPPYCESSMRNGLRP